MASRSLRLSALLTAQQRHVTSRLAHASANRVVLSNTGLQCRDSLLRVFGRQQSSAVPKPPTAAAQPVKPASAAQPAKPAATAQTAQPTPTSGAPEPAAPAATPKPATLSPPPASGPSGGGAGGNGGSSASKPPAPPGSGPAPHKPRAEGGSVMKRQKKRLWPIGGATFLSALLLYKLYTTGSERQDPPASVLGRLQAGLADMLANFRAYIEGLRETPVNDPTPEELQNALGPAMDMEVINVLIAMDDLLLRRDWHPRYGWRIELRPGVKEWFKKMQETGCVVTLWGDEASTTAVDVVNKMSLDFGFPLAITPLHLGSEHCFSHKVPADDPDVLARKAAHAKAGGAVPAEELGLISRAADALERLFGGPAGGKGRTVTVKDKNIQYFNRPARSILLVDTDPRQARNNPDNAFIVKTWQQYEAEAKAAAAAGRPAPPDHTLAAVLSVCERIRTDSAAAGQINVPRTLHSLRREASARGLPADEAGVFAVVQQLAAEASELERQRIETGLGGALRKTVKAVPVLRGKRTVAELAEAQRYVDPAVETGVPDSILANKVHRAVGRLQAMQGRGQ